jgi:hypothetical protein
MGGVRSGVLYEMSGPNPNGAGFYFGFPRLIQKLLGGSAARSESNWLEAYATGVLMYVLSYCYAVFWFELRRDSILSLLALVPLAFAMWIFWLIVVYVNSLVIRALRIAGVLSRDAKRQAQSVLIAALTSLFAYQLVRLNSPLRWLAFGWFVIVALNMLSSAILMFVHEREPATDE